MIVQAAITAKRWCNGAMSRLIRRFVPLDQARLTQIVAAQSGLTPITQTNDDDIFIVGYPKSGNTWLQNLAAGVLYHMDPAHATDTLIQELIPDVSARKYYHRFRRPMVFKSHDLPCARYRRVVYILRDGRDVMVSYYHHLRATRGDAIDWRRMIEQAEGLIPCRWHEHVEAWEANPYGANMITIRYEDLQQNPVVQLRRFCKFVGLEADETLLKLVAAGASFSSMRKKELQTGWAPGSHWPDDKAFVRRGVIGSYRDEMPDEVCQMLMAQAGATLARSAASGSPLHPGKILPIAAA